VRRGDGRHHDHALETETDVAVRRLSTSAGDGCVTLGWDYPGKTLLEVRILRSTESAAADPDDGAGAGQMVVYHGVTGSFRDEGLENGRLYHYSVFARRPGDAWVRWDDLELTPAAGRAWSAAAGLGALFLVLLTVLVVACAGALPARAEDGGQEGDAEAAAGAAQAAAWDIALHDPLVLGVLDGRQPESTAADVVPWSGEGRPGGATVYLLWPAGPAGEVDAELPVVRRREPDEPPVAPLEVVERRVRASGVTGLRVLVDLDRERVLEVYPWDEHADFTLHEDTSAPFSWVPWFTSHAWVLLPVFGALALALGVRAYLQSRAWRRRMPSMSRHDRQFVTRILLAALMGLAVVVMALAVWRALQVPLLDPDRLVGGGLSTWPLVLFPPLLYVAAVGLELTGHAHRVAWGLVAVIAGASCVYVLVAMREAAVTNVMLLYFILLGCLALVAIPRAFAPGKVGWSRSQGRAGSSF